MDHGNDLDRKRLPWQRLQIELLAQPLQQYALLVLPNHPFLPPDFHEPPVADGVRLHSGGMKELGTYPLPAFAFLKRETGKPAMVLMADEGRYMGGAFAAQSRQAAGLWDRVEGKAGAPPPCRDRDRMRISRKPAIDSDLKPAIFRTDPGSR